MTAYKNVRLSKADHDTLMAALVTACQCYFDSPQLTDKEFSDFARATKAAADALGAFDGEDGC